MHTPAYHKHEDSDCAVIFIHGFMGGPGQFADLAEAVHQMGCTYSSVLLPGHGCGLREFVKFGVCDWQVHVQSEIDKVKQEHKHIILIGHSMGGLLALNASLVRENPISAVVLLSTPLKVYWFNPRALWMKLRLVLLPKENEIRSAYRSSNSIAVSKFFCAPLILKPVIQFYQLVRQTKKQLADVFVPVYMFHSKNDETTSYRSAKLLYEGLCNTQRTALVLDKSWHAFYCESERQFIKDQVQNLIQEIGRTAD